MKIYKDLKPIFITNPVVTMGMFDGVHKGHRMLISNVIKHAKKTNGESVIITFWPHPKTIINKESTDLKYITTIDEKIKLLDESGIDHIVIIPFNTDLAKKSACEFTEEVIVNMINTKHFIAGFDHHFGRNREGSFQELNKCALNYNFSLEQLNPLLENNKIISSTRIRQLIESGDIVEANNYLGHDFFIYGKVIKGNQIGRSIEFPTANIEVADLHKLKPGIGVYAVEIAFEEELFKGMLNIGFRPTIKENVKTKTIEVHIFDFDKNIYEKNVSIIFKKKIRDEKKFNNLLELKSQLMIDKETALNYFSKAHDKNTFY